MDFYYSISKKLMSVNQSYTYKNSLTQVLQQQLHANGYREATVMPLAADLKKTTDGEIHSNVFFSTITMLGKALNQRPFDLTFLCLGIVEPRFENRLTLDPFRRDEYNVPDINIDFARSSKVQAELSAIALAIRTADHIIIIIIIMER
jgi:hypothetical protein